MKKYELMVIINESLSEAAATKEIDKLKALLDAQKAEQVKVDVWGNKKFAYTINYKNSGFYAVFTFVAATHVPVVLTSAMKINENIVRHMFVVLPNIVAKKAKAPKAPQEQKPEAKATAKETTVKTIAKKKEKVEE